jgi:tetratricopeptide (TPR) repeat protein
MAFAMNRIGINYHKFDDHEKSVEYHQKNIELSDFENIFAGYYNSGISLRFLGQYEKSLDHFYKALDWSLTKNVFTNFHLPIRI